MRFRTGKEMLDTITSGTDLYSRDKGIYVFVYNADNSIVHYNISNDERDRLKEKAAETGECISGFLGPGGSIADDPSYGGFQGGDYSNQDWCNEHYDGEWEIIQEDTND